MLVKNRELELIERIASRQWTTQAWLDYAAMRGEAVQSQIAKLSRFSAHNPASKPGRYCLAASYHLQSRLDAAMSAIATKNRR